jgi:hypothetical protein
MQSATIERRVSTAISWHYIVKRYGHGTTAVEALRDVSVDCDLQVGDGYSVVMPSNGRAWMRVMGVDRDPTILKGTLVTPETLHLISRAKDPRGARIDVLSSIRYE